MRGETAKSAKKGIESEKKNIRFKKKRKKKDLPSKVSDGREPKTGNTSGVEKRAREKGRKLGTNGAEKVRPTNKEP